MEEKTSRVYPHFVVENNKKPNRFYAFPFIGIMVKCVFLLPQFFEFFFLGIAALFALFINWLVILFSGKYWDPAYKLFIGMMRLSTKIHTFLYGITDKYPGFTFDTKDFFTLSIPKPTQPNRWFAVPFIGIFVRFILLFPYLIFAEVLMRGSGLAVIGSWFVVLFKGRFPESLFEFERDSLRVGLASSCYMLGLSDKYPSFTISMNHQTVKILLIIAGAIMLGMGMNGSGSDYEPKQNYRYDYTSGYDYNHESQPLQDRPSTGY